MGGLCGMSSGGNSFSESLANTFTPNDGASYVNGQLVDDATGAAIVAGGTTSTGNVISGDMNYAPNDTTNSNVSSESEAWVTTDNQSGLTGFNETQLDNQWGYTRADGTVVSSGVDKIDGGGMNFGGETFGYRGGRFVDENQDGYITDEELGRSVDGLEQNFISNTTNAIGFTPLGSGKEESWAATGVTALSPIPFTGTIWDAIKPDFNKPVTSLDSNTGELYGDELLNHYTSGLSGQDAIDTTVNYVVNEAIDMQVAAGGNESGENFSKGLAYDNSQGELTDTLGGLGTFYYDANGNRMYDKNEVTKDVTGGDGLYYDENGNPLNIDYNNKDLSFDGAGAVTLTDKDAIETFNEEVIALGEECGEGQYYDAVAGVCVDNKGLEPCGEGYIRGADGLCKLDIANPCGEGYHRNSLGTCVPNTTDDSCPTGYTRVGGTCVKDVIKDDSCQAGYTRVNGLCVPIEIADEFSRAGISQDIDYEYKSYQKGGGGGEYLPAYIRKYLSGMEIDDMIREIVDENGVSTYINQDGIPVDGNDLIGAKIGARIEMIDSGDDENIGWSVTNLTTGKTETFYNKDVTDDSSLEDQISQSKESGQLSS